MRRYRLLHLGIIGLLSIAPAAAAGADTATRTVVPAEIQQPLNNPYMGWGLWAGPRYLDSRNFSIEYNTTGFGDDAQLFDWVLIDWMWSDLEPAEGKYDWKDLDTVLNYWGARGKQVDLRVWVTDDPGWNGKPGNEVCPEWVWKAGVKYHEYLAQKKFPRREPDYTDPSYESVYLPKVRTFLKALAERYDKADSPVMMWGVMGYGQWGEWHTMWSKYPWPNRDVKHKVLANIVNMYADIFRLRIPCISYVNDSDAREVTSLEDHMYRQALDVAVSKGFALARHGFIDGLGIRDSQMMQAYWRKVPMWAESNWTYIEVKDEHVHGTLNEYMDIYRAWHSNWAHYYMDAESYRRAMKQDRVHFEEGLKSGGLGYRFVLTSAGWSEQVPAGNLFVVKQTWVNRNVGRLYIRHPLKVYLTDAEGNEKHSAVDRTFDQTQWVAGETYPVISVYRIPKSLPPGDYDVRIAMVDQNSKPRINLAIEGADSQKRYRLGTIRVAAPQE